MQAFDAVVARVHNAWFALRDEESRLFTLRDEESGQTLVEYALIIAVVSLGAVAALTLLRDEIVGVFSDSKVELEDARNNTP